MVAMANKLSIKVIAEEVETQAQRDYLHFIECDYIQGYLISHPIDAQAFEKKFFTLPLEITMPLHQSLPKHF